MIVTMTLIVIGCVANEPAELQVTHDHSDHAELAFERGTLKMNEMNRNKTHRRGVCTAAAYITRTSFRPMVVDIPAAERRSFPARHTSPTYTMFGPEAFEGY